MTDNTIVFADLTHTGKKLDATFMPLAVSYIASYFKSQRPDAEVELFKYPTDLATYLAANDVRVAAFSDYCWNERLSLGFARAIKKMSPRTVTIFGGPNCPYDPAEIAAFLGERPGVDFYVAGEGEIAFVELYDALAAVDFDVARLKRAGTQVSNTRYLDGDGQLVCGPMLPRMNDLDVIPSPYLSGMMDKFFDGRLTPMIQNARGCPYSCTFCHDGLEYMTKYRRFDHGRICDEIDYVKDRKKGPALCIVDDNFGIHKNDLAVAKKIGAIRTDTGWPNFISYGGTAKNNKERIVEISREMGDAIEAGASVQSTDADVLASIKRSNISTVTISDMARKVAENGVTSFTEIILCLPGDTIEKHQHSVYEMMDLDIQDFKLFQFILLPGTEAASTAHREKFAYATAWRVFPRCFGHYEVGGERFSVAEASEVCIANNTMPADDYMECRKFDLTVGIFFNGGTYEELFHFLNHRGIRRSQFLARIYEAGRRGSEGLQKIYEWFEEDERRSFFPTQESLLEFIAQPDTVDRYISGEFGINQMMHARAMALSAHFDEVCALTFKVARGLLAERGAIDGDSELYLTELQDLLSLRKSNVFEVRPPIERIYHFDFPALTKTGFLADPFNFKQPHGVPVRIDHSDIKKTDISKYSDQFGNSIDGMSHFLQRSAIRSVFRDIVAA